MPNDPQVPWTDEQWARVNQVIQEEASRARVAASFLPLSGPLPPDTDFVRAQIIPSGPPLTIEDRDTIQLATLQVKVEVRSAQMADPELASVLALFRRAANVIARLEDAVVFRGLVQPPPSAGPPRPIQPPAKPPGGAPQPIWEIQGGRATPGLWAPIEFPWTTPFPKPDSWQQVKVAATGGELVTEVSKAIGLLEGNGHFGPFAAVLGQGLFLAVQKPDQNSLVLPQDRIIPFLGGGSLLRSSTLGAGSGVVVALGGAPVELVIATDVSLQFLRITEKPSFLFRVREKIALRIKEAGAIVSFYIPPTVAKVAPATGPAAGGGPDVVITGTNLDDATELQFGGTVVPPQGPEVPNGFAVNSDTQITVPQPAGIKGEVVHVKVTTPSGKGPERDSKNNQFTYD